MSRALPYRPLHALSIASLFLSLLTSVPPLQTVSASTTIVVNSFEDKVNNDAMCTLREAIVAANRDSASGRRSGECLAGCAADVITHPAGTYTLTRTDAGKEDSGATGDLATLAN